MRDTEYELYQTKGEYGREEICSGQTLSEIRELIDAMEGNDGNS